MWCHNSDKNIQNKANCRAFAKFKKEKKDHFESQSGFREKSLAFLFEEINTLKRKLKPNKAASSKKGDNKS
jgi:hypothetical protein